MINLNGCKVQDKGWEHIQSYINFSSLTSLTVALDSTGITNATLLQLSNGIADSALTHLELSFMLTQLGDYGVQQLFSQPLPSTITYLSLELTANQLTHKAF